MIKTIIYTFMNRKFWQMDHVFAKFASIVFCLICYYVCAETTTHCPSGINIVQI